MNAELFSNEFYDKVRGIDKIVAKNRDLLDIGLLGTQPEITINEQIEIKDWSNGISGSEQIKG